MLLQTFTKNLQHHYEQELKKDGFFQMNMKDLKPQSLLKRVKFQIKEKRGQK